MHFITKMPELNMFYLHDVYIEMLWWPLLFSFVCNTVFTVENNRNLKIIILK